MADAHRGVIFTFKARTDASVGREAARMSEIAAEAQRRFDAIHFDPLHAGQFETSLTRMSESYQQHVTKMNGKKIAPKADASGWKALSAAGKEALDNQKRWAAGVEKLDAQRAANAKAAADAEIRQINRVQKERLKTLRQETKSDSDYWKGFEKHGQKSKKDREREEDHDRREAERQALIDRRRAEREAKERTADESQWDLILGGRPRGGPAGTGTAGMRGPGRRDISDPFGLADYQQGQQRERRRQEQAEQRERRDAEIALARQRENYHRLGESIGSTTDAVTRLAEGMAYLGLIGERDLGRLSDSLLAIRGTVDTIRGGVGALRDLGGLIRSVREVRHAGGVGGIGRAIMGMGPAVGGAAAAGTGAAGAAVGAAGATGGAAGLTTGGMAAAFSAPAGVIVGGIVAAVALAADQAIAGGRFTRAIGRAGGGALKGVMRFADDVAMSMETAGKQDFEKRDIELERLYKRFDTRTGQEYDIRRPNERKGLDMTIPGVGIGAVKASELSDINRERAEQYRELQKRKRVEQGASQTVSLEYQTRNAQEKMEARRLGRSVIFNRLAADAQVDPNSLFYQVQAGREKSMSFRMEEHKHNVADAERERNRTRKELRNASSSGRDTPGYEAAFRMHEEAERRIIELEERGLQLAREQRTIEIDGARQRLQLTRDQLTLTRDRKQNAEENRDSFFERFGRLDPIQQRAVASAQERVLNGTDTRADRELVAQYGDELGQTARKDREMGIGREAAKNLGLGTMEEQEVSNARGREKTIQDELSEQIDKEQERLGKGVKIGVGIDNKFAISIKQDDNFYQNLESHVINALKPLLKERDARLPDYIQDVARRVAAEVTNDAIAQQNQQGRNVAGGGGLP